jgi:hypothetical protein
MNFIWSVIIEEKWFTGLNYPARKGGHGFFKPAVVGNY